MPPSYRRPGIYWLRLSRGSPGTAVILTDGRAGPKGNASDHRDAGEESPRSTLIIVDKVGAFFARTNAGAFDKWKVAAVLRDRIAKEPAKVPDAAINGVDAINTKLNRLFTA